MEIGLQDVVKLLRVPEATVSRWVRQGYIPCTYRNGNYLFNPVTLKSWAKSKQLHLSHQRQIKPEAQSTESADLIEALKLGGVHYKVKGGTKQEVFQEVEQLFAFPTQQSPPLAEQLMKREKLAVTAIGRGIAIPHPQIPKDWGLGGALVGTFFLETPLEFGAVDQVPVFVLFVLLSPTSQVHLQLLANLARILRRDDLIDFIRKQSTPEDLVSQFKKVLEENN
ncbi:MAG: PTS sugar transporter subunit IIA [SAR324 cluster bacterium]|nr:PTS sugar transporter subunit IIA [SAR324 cluster bacterium]